MTTTEVENFPGFPDGIMGPELMDDMRKQAERFGAEFLTDDVTRVELVDTGARLRRMKTVCVGETAYRAKAVILATGSAWRPLGVPGEQELLGHGVSSCATCDGFFFRGQHIVVVGGGDSAMEEATFLTQFAETVTIIHRRDEFRASKIMAERALANPKIKVEWNTVVEEVLGDDGKVAGVRVRNVHTGDDARSSTSPACSSRSATTRAASCSAARSTLDENGYVLVEAPEHAHQRARRVRRRRPGRPHLPAGDHRRRHGLRRRARRRAVHRHRWTEPRSSIKEDLRGNHQGRHRRQLRQRRAAVRQAGAGGLLGRVVRAVPQGRRRCSRRSPARWATRCEIVKLDIDDNPETARAYRVMSVPTLTIFKGGEPVQSVAGARPKGDLVRLIESAL